MSEFQSYTFSTVDRSLTRAERKEVSNLSSHIEVSSTGAYVEYQYGDFKHNPIEVLLRFFDILVYDTNWGQQQIAFRFDAEEVDASALDPFTVAEGIEIQAREGSILVETFFDENQRENGWFGSPYDDWDEENEVPTKHFDDLHRAISQGDYRSLLILLVKATCLEDDEAEEINRRLIPLTPGCGALTESLQTLTALVDLGPDWIEALAAFNPTKKPQLHQATNWMPALSQLPSSERDSFLRRLLENDPTTVRGELKRRLRSLLPAASLQNPSHQPESVPWSAIREKATTIRRERERRARKEEEMRERAYVDAIIRHEHRLWSAAQSAIETKTTKGYDRAVALLKVLENSPPPTEGLCWATVPTSGRSITARYNQRSRMEVLQNEQVQESRDQLPVAARYPSVPEAKLPEHPHETPPGNAACPHSERLDHKHYGLTLLRS